jgi:hypothetical protein
MYQAVIVIFIIILLFYYYSSNNVDDYLDGFWGVDKMSDPTFCKRADIDSMLLYIGDPTHGWFETSRLCYIIINDTLKECFLLKYKPTRGSITKYKINATSEFEKNPIWPQDLNIKISMMNGVCKIKDDDSKLYARLIKYHDVSNLAKSNKVEK